MPTGPQGQKRSDSETTAAVQVAKIATGQAQESPASARKTVTLHLGGEKPLPPIPPAVEEILQRQPPDSALHNIFKLNQKTLLRAKNLFRSKVSRLG